MLSFVTVVSLKALIYVASLGIFAGNLWLFKDNVYTFTHLLAASKNGQLMSPFDGPAPLPNDAGPILSPAITATQDETPDFNRDDEDDDEEEEENDDGHSAYMDQIRAAYTSPTRSPVPHPVLQMLPGLALLLMLSAIIISKCFKAKPDETIEMKEQDTAPHEEEVEDNVAAEAIPLSSSTLLDAHHGQVMCADIVRSILQDAFDHTEAKQQQQCTATITYPHQFMNEVVDIEDDCDRHHHDYNHPGWACNHCRIGEQNRIDSENEVQELRTQLAFSETQLQNHQLFIEKFDIGLKEVLENNRELSANNASLKIDVFQKDGRIKTLETLLADVERMHADVSDKLDTLKDHHEYVVERNRQLTVQNDELNIQVNNLRLDCLTFNKANEKLKNRMTSFQNQFEKQLVDCTNRLEFQMLEFSR